MDHTTASPGSHVEWRSELRSGSTGPTLGLKYREGWGGGWSLEWPEPEDEGVGVGSGGGGVGKAESSAR